MKIPVFFQTLKDNIYFEILQISEANGAEPLT